MIKRDKEETFCFCGFLLVLSCWSGILEETLCKNDNSWHGNDFGWSFCPTFTGKLLGELVYKKCGGVQNRSLFWWEHKQKKKRKATWGKYTSGAWGSKRFGGWSKDGLKWLINSILKYKKIEKKVMQFMWKKGIGCVVLATHPEKEKGLFMKTSLLSKWTTCKPYYTDKFLILASTLYILKLLFSY